MKKKWFVLSDLQRWECCGRRSGFGEILMTAFAAGQGELGEGEEFNIKFQVFMWWVLLF
jgi:hypothetical protein